MFDHDRQMLRQKALGSPEIWPTRRLRSARKACPLVLMGPMVYYYYYHYYYLKVEKLAQLANIMQFVINKALTEPRNVWAVVDGHSSRSCDFLMLKLGKTSDLFENLYKFVGLLLWGIYTLTVKLCKITAFRLQQQIRHHDLSF